MNPIACQLKWKKSRVCGALRSSLALQATTAKATPNFPLDYWISTITTAWRRGASNTLELASLLSQAKASLRYGEWSRLWQVEQVPFSKRKGEMLVVIGNALGSLDAQNSAQLPSAWNTLYYVARLGCALVEHFIQQGRVHARLTLREARALLAKYQPTKLKVSRPRVKQRLAQFSAFVRSTLANWSPDERQAVQAEFLRLIKEVGISPHQSQPRSIATLHNRIERPSNLQLVPQTS